MTYVLALISGALLALSFPRYGHPAFGWIALVPLLLALSGWNGRPGRLRGQSPLRGFLLGLVAGIVYFAGTVYWTGTVVATFGEVPMPIAMIGMVLLAAYLGLYPAFTALVMSHLIARMGMRALFLAPAAWVATEYLRGSALRRVPLGAAREFAGDGSLGVPSWPACSASTACRCSWPS